MCISVAWKPALQAVGNRVFNVGSDDQNYRIDEVAEIIGDALGKIPIARDNSNLDARDYRVSFARLEQTLGFHSQQTIQNAARDIFEKLQTAINSKSFSKNIL